MKKLLLVAILLGFTAVALYKTVPEFRHAVYYRYFISTRPEVVGGPCGPNCEGYNEFPPFPLNNTDTLPDFLVNDTSRIRVSGVIYDFDGKPAPGVLLYVFQANTAGIYPKTGKETGAGKLNGYLRGWMKTDEDGRYEFYSNQPGAYPGTKRMAHIHCVIKEPNLNAYTLPDFVFPGDPNLTNNARHTHQSENGGLLKFVSRNVNRVAHYSRDMYLGRKVVNYPEKKKSGK